LTELCGWTPPESTALAYCFAIEEREILNNKKEKVTPQKITDSTAEDEENTKILNSFYVEELQMIKKVFAENNCGAAVKAYLLENEISDTDKFNLA
jgi:hypothetical protein